MKFMTDQNISHPFQGAFVKGRSGTDHIFVANTLIDQAKQLGYPLYSPFIELRKAFDSVCRPLLFKKMINYRMGEKFFTLVEDMYVQATCVVFALNPFVGIQMFKVAQIKELNGLVKYLRFTVNMYVQAVKIL